MNSFHLIVRSEDVGIGAEVFAHAKGPPRTLDSKK